MNMAVNMAVPTLPAIGQGKRALHVAATVVVGRLAESTVAIARGLGKDVLISV